MGKLKSLFSCAGKSGPRTREDGQHTYEHSFAAIKPAKQTTEPGTARLFVRMASTSDITGGAGSSEGTASPNSEQADPAGDEEVWYECEASQDWLETAADEADAPTAAAGLRLTAEQEACLGALPPRLGGLLSKYLRGIAAGCKPLVALMHYMQDSGTSLPELQALLAPLLAAEQHLPEHLPIPVPHMPAAERTAELCRQLQQLHTAVQSHADGASSGVGGSAGACLPQHQPRLALLLRNLQLTTATLDTISSEEGWRQVATGPLQLWYCHDTVAKSQMIRAKVVLEEPLSVIATIAREFDLVSSWNPGMSDMRELASYSPTELLIYLLPWMPWPLPLPELVNYCFGVDLLDLHQGCMLFHTSSAELPAGIEVPQHARTMAMHMKVGGFKLVPLQPLPDKPDTPRTEVTVLVSIDAARFVVPDNIISCMLKVLAPLVYRSVLKVLTRMFHQAASAAPGKAADGAVQRSSPSVCSTSMLLERRALRPEYAALDAHAAAVLAAAAEAGPARPLELDSARMTQAGAGACNMVGGMLI